jgi:hypothetical protein
LKEKMMVLVEGVSFAVGLLLVAVSVDLLLVVVAMYLMAVEAIRKSTVHTVRSLADRKPH